VTPDESQGRHAPTVEGRPMPRPDDLSKHFWSSVRAGRLLVQRCPECQHTQFYPRALCTACGADPEWLETSGKGEVYTFTVIHQNGARPFADEVPYVVAMIELAEGPRMMGNITDCDPEDVHIGMAVTWYPVEVNDEIGFPFWRPVSR
jgi:uncharacterized protein